MRAGALFHFVPSGLRNEGNGEPFPQSCPEGIVYGPGPGFHPDPNDHLLRDVLHGPEPLHNGKSLCGTQSGPQEAAEVVLFQEEMTLTAGSTNWVLLPIQFSLSISVWISVGAQYYGTQINHQDKGLRLLNIRI